MGKLYIAASEDNAFAKLLIEYFSDKCCVRFLKTYPYRLDFSEYFPPTARMEIFNPSDAVLLIFRLSEYQLRAVEEVISDAVKCRASVLFLDEETLEKRYGENPERLEPVADFIRTAERKVMACLEYQHPDAVEFNSEEEINDCYISGADKDECIKGPCGNRIIKKDVIVSGPCGQIYNAIDQWEDIAISLREIKLENLSHERICTQYAIEGKSIPGIILPSESFKYGDCFYSVFYGALTGKPLSSYADGTEWCRDIGMSPEENLVDAFAGMLDSLSGLHEAYCCFTDISPESIFLDEDGRILLFDTGLICSADHLCLYFLTEGASVYYPPEYFGSPVISIRGDIYSAAIAGYRFFFGETPDKNGVMSAALKEKLAKNPYLAAVLRKASSPVPEKRFRDMKAFAKAIRKAEFSV